MGSDALPEDVPRINRRAGDCILASENNSAILLGRDRNGPVASGHGDSLGAGAIHLVVGRKSGDPSVKDDSATIYLSARTDPDDQAETSSIGKSSSAVSGIVLRGDCVRIVPRTDIKISVGSAYLLISSDGKITVEGDISLGQGAGQRAMRGDAFSQFWSQIVVQTPSGPASPLPPIPDSVFSTSVKVR